MRCLVMVLLLGLGIHGLAMGLEGARFAGDPSDKIASQLRKAVEPARTQGWTASTQRAMRWLDGQQLEVFVYHQCDGDHPLLQHPVFGINYAKIHYSVLHELAALPCVRQITPPVYAHRRVGSVTSAGDLVMRAAETREAFSVDGSNVRIGIISDSLSNLAASVNTGDLPPDVVIVNGEDGSNIPGTIDEGRAMAELIHDLAPGATLMFHTGFPTSLDMIEAIRALTAAGADIIVDDLGFFLEPYFEDGPTAQAVQEAIDAGVFYVTAVGNDAEANYSGMFQELDPDDGDDQNNLHDFDSSAGTDGTMGVTLAPRGLMRVVLQWPNSFDGSANTADYNLHVLNAAGTEEACLAPGISGDCVGDNRQLTGAISPFETVVVENNTSRSVSLNLVINRLAGEALPLRMVFGGDVSVDEHNVPGRSAFGHPCVSEALAVGAINAADPGFDTIEPFSSRGPCEIFFSPNAGLLAVSREADGVRTSQAVPLVPPAIRVKPDVVGADGTNTSVLGFAPFFGTSAAAPHAAAVAALLMDLSGGPAFTTVPQMLSLMRIAAVDQGVPGVDNIYGFGVADALQAANVSQGVPVATILSPTEDVTVTSGDTVSFQGNCSDLNDDRPFTFNWDFDGGAVDSTEQNPSVIFTQSETFTVTMTCTNNTGLTSLADTIRVIVNAADGGGGGGGGGALSCPMPQLTL